MGIDRHRGYIIGSPDTLMQPGSVRGDGAGRGAGRANQERASMDEQFIRAARCFLRRVGS
jgi:hypothetical protein